MLACHCFHRVQIWVDFKPKVDLEFMAQSQHPRTCVCVEGSPNSMPCLTLQSPAAGRWTPTQEHLRLTHTHTYAQLGCLAFILERSVSYALCWCQYKIPQWAITHKACITHSFLCYGKVHSGSNFFLFSYFGVVVSFILMFVPLIYEFKISPFALQNQTDYTYKKMTFNTTITSFEENVHLPPLTFFLRE